MLKFIGRFFYGSRRVKVKNEDSAAVFDILYRDDISFENEKRDGESITFTLTEVDYIACIEKLAPYAEVSDMSGFPYLCRFIRLRPFVLLGVLVFFAWMKYSSGIVWDIKIDGNTKTDYETITDTLAELGFEVGVPFENINYNQLHADYVALQNDIAWLSIFMNGTVAEVQVRELYRDEREKHPNDTYANVVAKCDGIVEEINVFEGQATVTPGQLVRAGQVLISGVCEGREGEYRFEYASGEVICQTVEAISERISTTREKKTYTGREKRDYAIKFFKKTINLFGKGGIDGGVCDTISTMEKLCPFGLCEIPVWLETNVSREYVTENEQISTETAGNEAMYSLVRKIRELTADAELEHKEIHSEFEDGVYILNCMLYLRRNIGLTKEFTVKAE